MADSANPKNPFEPHYIQCRQWLELLEELNIGAFMADCARKIVSINHAGQALIGLKAGEVIGQDCGEIFTGVPCMVRCVLMAAHRNSGTEPDVEISDEEDKRHILTRLATPVFHADGRVAGCLTVLQDHSPMVELIDRINFEERSLKIILDNLDIGVFTVNRGGHITFFNSAAENISGYNRRQLLGKSSAAILGGPLAMDYRLLKKSIASGSTQRTRNGRIAGRDGETVPVQANFLALKNEKDAIVGGLATFSDLTLVHQFNQAVRERYTFHDMIGKSPAMQRIFETVSVVAATDATVLIEGTTGTGKDLMAKAIHSASRRADAPMVKVCCAAIPDSLIESEMFGYVKGAFTGADQDKPGRFNEADGGTIFLDEIGDLPLSLQAKLLRVIEDQEFYPLGSRSTSKVNVRIISATNRGLESLVAGHLFREDLFYRLNVFRFKLPDLKERRIDLPLLIRHILRRLSAARDNRRMGISETAMEILLNFDYPGNVRELENILEHAVIICPHDTIEPGHLPEYVRHRTEPDYQSARPSPAVDSRESEERTAIAEALRRHSGHRTKAAQALGMNRTTLWRKMKRYQLSP